MAFYIRTYVLVCKGLVWVFLAFIFLALDAWTGRMRLKCSIRSVEFSFGLLSYFCWHRPWSTIYFRPTGFEHIKPTMRRVGYTLDKYKVIHTLRSIHFKTAHWMTEELSLASLQNTFTWIPLTLDSIIWIKISQNWSKVTYEACLSIKNFTIAGCIWKLFYCGPPPLTNDHCSSSSLLQPFCCYQKETEAKELIT